ncbi:hypothetical protein ABW20_dc0100566 [Dactylellina cionopaga]|nr:hypothetical protein ABW20_dc0100566 [Dactylellina cionopaga]
MNRHLDRYKSSLTDTSQSLLKSSKRLSASASPQVTKMSGLFSSWTQAAKNKVSNISVSTLSLPTFTEKTDVDHPENEDESAVSRALREYYKEKDGFVPDWLSPSPMRTSSPGMQAAANRAAAPPQKMATGGAQTSLGDIFGNAPPPQQPQQQQAPPQQQPQAQAQPEPQAAPARRPPVGLPGGPRGGVKPFMAMKRERQQAQTAPPQQQQQYQPPPPQNGRQQSYPPPSAASQRQQQAPAAYSGNAGGRRTFGDAPGDRRGPSSNDKPVMSATAPWSGGAENEFRY